MQRAQCNKEKKQTRGAREMRGKRHNKNIQEAVKDFCHSSTNVDHITGQEGVACGTQVVSINEEK